MSTFQPSINKNFNYFGLSVGEAYGCQTRSGLKWIFLRFSWWSFGGHVPCQKSKSLLYTNIVVKMFWLFLLILSSWETRGIFIANQVNFLVKQDEENLMKNIGQTLCFIKNKLFTMPGRLARDLKDWIGLSCKHIDWVGKW